jgi:hypothetical protein
MRFELSDQTMMVIMTALGNHAYREAAPVIADLQQQYNQQRQQMNGGRPLDMSRQEQPNGPDQRHQEPMA